MCMNSSVALHAKLFQGVLQAPMIFFEQNPVGKDKLHIMMFIFPGCQVLFVSSLTVFFGINDMFNDYHKTRKDSEPLFQRHWDH
jgi:hypothetical protein